MKAKRSSLSGFCEDSTSPETGIQYSSVSDGPPRIGKGELYVMIPVEWLRQAVFAGRTARRSRRTTETALALWFRSRCSRSADVQLSRRDLELFGLDRWAYYRALAALECSGLVEIERHPGRKLKIRLLSVPGSEQTVGPGR